VNPLALPEDTPVIRYLSLAAVTDVLRDRKLRLTLVDHLRQTCDPFEGSVPKAEIDKQVVIFSGAYSNMMQQIAPHYPGTNFRASPHNNLDPWTRVKRIRLAKALSAHVSCWMWGDESEGMWRLYCNDESIRGRGVALQTTLGALKKSVAPFDLIVCPITYLHYHEAGGAGFDHELDPFMHKRKGFEHERELRVLKFDDEHFTKLLKAVAGEDLSAAGALANHINLDWDTTSTIERIIVGPYADDRYENAVRHAVENADPSMATRVERSVLDPRRYEPQF